eukprot:gnl/TRDRNA2_/TRDRNA2_151780_c0_seq1.p1 gnl/TRDRNA2_/TRDRNA2_151780_c0~~gnl/TRDRNA2_/TRDRNA2_151780_c0_seq1.p1  ORF type:complete len:108 (+),score=9.06 gnl/TRDRNA2_/TRDRNA2_151780_c0_seq1:224-547(+)
MIAVVKTLGVELYKKLTGKFHVQKDETTYGVNRDAPLEIINNTDGTVRAFEGEDLERTLASIYSTMIVHYWKVGDVLIVDNLRWSHARLEGATPDRILRGVIYSYVS